MQASRQSLSHSPLYSVKLEDGTDEVMNDSSLNFTNIKRSGNVVIRANHWAGADISASRV